MEETKPDFLVGMSANLEIGFKSPLADEIIDLAGYSKLQIKGISVHDKYNYSIPVSEDLTDDILSKLPEFKEGLPFGAIENPRGLRIVASDEAKFHTDGSAINVARVLKSLGMKPLLISPLGGDSNGEIVKSALDGWGIRYLDLPRKEAAVSLNIWGQASSLLLICKSPYSINVRDTVSKIGKECGGTIPAISIMTGIRRNDLRLLQAIFDRGSEIYLCPSMDLIKHLGDEEVCELFAKCTFIQMSVPELEAAFSCMISPWSQNSEHHIARAMHILRDNGWQNTIVTNGEKGVFTLFQGEDVYFYNAYPLPGKFVDDTGAGDAFAAGFRWHYLQNQDICEAVRFGCVVAAYSITGDGSVERLPTVDEGKKWLEEWKTPTRHL